MARCQKKMGLGLFVLLLGVNYAVAVDDIAQSLTIARHTDVSIGSPAIEQKLSDATVLLRKKDRPSDVACCVHLKLSGSFGSFGSPGDGDDFIQSEGQLLRVMNGGGGQIKIVRKMAGVDLCNSDVVGNIAGCAERGGGKMVIKAGAKKDIWAHEIGHMQGLEHRNGSSKLLMHENAMGTDEINSLECGVFQKDGIAAGMCPL